MSSIGWQQRRACLRTATFNAILMIPDTIGETILVIDDCPNICELIELLLVRVGYVVRTATNAADALALAHSMRELDVVLCGLELPDMPGEQLAPLISAEHPSASIILVSASFKPSEPQKYQGVLEKPFTIAELRTVVRSALRGTPAFAESTLWAAL